jgi:peptide/nickel transport system permease protein
MLSDGRNYLRRAWWITTFPGMAIMMTVLAINMLGDGLRDALDPRLRT